MSRNRKASGSVVIDGNVASHITLQPGVSFTVANIHAMLGSIMHTNPKMGDALIMVADNLVESEARFFFAERVEVDPGENAPDDADYVSIPTITLYPGTTPIDNESL